MKKKSYQLDQFPMHTIEKLRFKDMDRQGHVNNAVHISLIEAARIEMFDDPQYPLREEGTMYMLAHISIDYMAELNWPGFVDIGTRIVRIGTRSFTTEQAIFKEGVCVAVATTVIVKASTVTRQSVPLSDMQKINLQRLLVPETELV